MKQHSSPNRPNFEKKVLLLSIVRYLFSFCSSFQVLLLTAASFYSFSFIFQLKRDLEAPMEFPNQA